MQKSIITIALAGAVLFGLEACTSGGFKKTKDGLEYNIVNDEKEGKAPVAGDMIGIHVIMSVIDGDGDKTDTVIMDSRKMNNNMPIEFVLNAPSFKGDIAEGIMLMTPGDSAVFRMSIDSIKKSSPQPLPDFMKSGGKIVYKVKLVSVKNQAEMMKQQQEQAAAAQQQAAQQMQVDEKLLQDYFTKNNLKPTKTASGLYYIIEKPGTGSNIAAGQQVTMNYTGKTLDGTPFDSNVDPKFQHVEPFTFAVGQGQVIPGWDEGVQLLKKGSKAKFFIPSPLAYGAQSPSADLPANSVLVFDVEVKEVAAAQAPQAPVVQ